MSTTKTVSTRVNENVYNSLVDYANEEGQTISQVLHQLVDERIQLSKEMLDDSKRSITADDDNTTIATAEFEQKRSIDEEMKQLQNKNIQEIAKQHLVISLGKYLDELKYKIDNLTTSFDKKLEEDRMKKGMACFQNDSCFPTS